MISLAPITIPFNAEIKNNLKKQHKVTPVLFKKLLLIHYFAAS